MRWDKWHRWQGSKICGISSYIFPALRFHPFTGCLLCVTCERGELKDTVFVLKELGIQYADMFRKTDSQNLAWWVSWVGSPAQTSKTKREKSGWMPWRWQQHSVLKNMQELPLEKSALDRGRSICKGMWSHGREFATSRDIQIWSVRRGGRVSSALSCPRSLLKGIENLWWVKQRHVCMNKVALVTEGGVGGKGPSLAGGKSSREELTTTLLLWGSGWEGLRRRGARRREDCTASTPGYWVVGQKSRMGASGLVLPFTRIQEKWRDSFFLSQCFHFQLYL